MWSRSCPELKQWLGRGLAVLVMAALAQVPTAQADDPLDEKDGTEDWDQVIGGKRQPKLQKKDAKQAQLEFKQQISEWESIRLLWTGEREGYLLEKALHNQLAAQHKAARRAAPTPAQDDDAGGSRTAGQPSDAWGDDGNGPMFVPGSSLDKAIDGELRGSGKPSKASRGAGQAGPNNRGSTNAELPPDGGELPSAFRQPVRKEDDSSHMGGPAPVNKSEDEDAKAAAREMKEQKAAEEQRRLADEQQRKKDEEERRKREEQEAKAKKAAEEDDGAAAAAKFLKEQEEKQRKEQEALQKKAKLKTDSEGQVVDPELQKESGDESP